METSVNKALVVFHECHVHVSWWILLQIALVQRWYLDSAHRKRFIFLIPMSDTSSPPLSFCNFVSVVCAFVEERTETPISNCIHSTAIYLGALSDDCFQLCQSSGCFATDICCKTQATMHDERTFVHTRLRGCEDKFEVRLSSSHGVDGSLWANIDSRYSHFVWDPITLACFLCGSTKLRPLNCQIIWAVVPMRMLRSPTRSRVNF